MESNTEEIGCIKTKQNIIVQVIQWVNFDLPVSPCECVRGGGRYDCVAR